MSRLRLAVLLAFVYACTDQNEPTDPQVRDGPDDLTLDDGVSGVELELDLAESHHGAHTALSGGATTIFDQSEEAFGSPAPNLQGENVERHEVGDVAFGLEHIDGPGLNGGLGPLFDNVACRVLPPG